MPRSARGAATFETILIAAERLLGRHGYAAVTTNHVADTAGVGIGSLYEYFPDKDAIVAEVARRTVQSILDEIAAAFLATPLDDPRAALRAWVRAMFAAVRARRDTVRVLWREVPFLWDLAEIRDLPERMLALARSARLPGTAPTSPAELEAATFLLTVMVSQAVITATIALPSTVSAEVAEETLARMLETLVLT